MNRTMLVMICLAGSCAWADDGDEAGTDGSDAVDLRVEVLEQIDVTAQKTAVESDADFDADIEAIILEAETLEKSDGVK